jgi:hypothetical protein
MLFLASMFFYLTLSFTESEGAEFAIKPSLVLRQEYDDNIFLTRDNRESDFITRVLPSFNLSYNAPLWEWKFDYTLHWAYYSKLGESQDSHNASLASKAKLIRNFLYLDINDVYSNVVLDPRQPSTETNLRQNRTDTNNLTVSPFIRYQVNPSVVLTTGYRYTNIWYREENGINRQMHTGFAGGEYTISPVLSAHLGAEYTADRPEDTERDNRQMAVFVRALYRLGPRTDLDGTIGYRSIDIDEGRDRRRPLYNAGVVYRISEKGQVEFRVASTVATSPTLGVLESRTEQISARYGELLLINGSIFHRKDNYFATGRKDNVYGGTAAMEYKFNPRLTFKVGGRYEKDRFLTERENRKIFSGLGEIGYQLTQKMALVLSYIHTRENGRTRADDYTNNVAAIQLKITF